MIIIPPEKIKSKGDTIQMFPADQNKFKAFYRDASINASRKNTRATPGYASTADTMSGLIRSRFAASIISVINADWTWGGGLFVLSATILPEFVGKEETSSGVIADVASRFSRIAGLAVGLFAISALYNAWAYVGSIEVLGKSTYGRNVIAKIILFFILMNLGAFNRYVSVPLLILRSGKRDVNSGFLSRFINASVQHHFGLQEGPRVFKRFKRSVSVEEILIVGVLFCAAMLRQEMPARHALHAAHVEASVIPASCDTITSIFPFLNL